MILQPFVLTTALARRDLEESILDPTTVGELAFVFGLYIVTTETIHT
ncbi:hypothetical protein [Natronorubrum halophilum]|nr:hypothetical protein [Natronorubrum halophilum]